MLYKFPSDIKVKSLRLKVTEIVPSPKGDLFPTYEIDVPQEKFCIKNGELEVFDDYLAQLTSQSMRKGAIDVMFHPKFN